MTVFVMKDCYRCAQHASWSIFTCWLFTIAHSAYLQLSFVYSDCNSCSEDAPYCGDKRHAWHDLLLQGKNCAIR